MRWIQLFSYFLQKKASNRFQLSTGNWASLRSKPQTVLYNGSLLNYNNAWKYGMMLQSNGINFYSELITQSNKASFVNAVVKHSEEFNFFCNIVAFYSIILNYYVLPLSKLKHGTIILTRLLHKPLGTSIMQPLNCHINY